MAKIVGTRERIDRTFYSTVHIYPDAERAVLKLFCHTEGGNVPVAGSGPMKLATSVDTNVITAGYFPADTSFVLLMWEACVVEGRSDPEIQSALEQLQLQLTIGLHPVADAIASTICVMDAVLEARVRRIEDALNALASLDKEDGQIQRLQNGLRRLGWKGYESPDHRRFGKPHMIPPRQSYGVRLVIADRLPISRRLILRVMLRGILSRDVL